MPLAFEPIDPSTPEAVKELVESTHRRAGDLMGALVVVARAIAANVAYLAALAGVVVLGLSTWTRFHLSIRALPVPTDVAFLSVFVILSVPGFLAAWWVSRRLLFVGPRWAQHLLSTAALYLCAFGTMWFIVSNPVRGHHEGGDIAIRVVLATCVLGTSIDGLARWWVDRGRAFGSATEHQ